MKTLSRLAYEAGADVRPPTLSLTQLTPHSRYLVSFRLDGQLSLLNKEALTNSLPWTSPHFCGTNIYLVLRANNRWQFVDISFFNLSRLSTKGKQIRLMQKQQRNNGIESLTVNTLIIAHSPSSLFDRKQSNRRSSLAKKRCALRVVIGRPCPH